ncbi:tetratricopeptide repeat protein, partial [Pseudanabaenaceae cyanobacterium LEGE 13415]|nr:tetratricopeptide repeat protein [Pseudanabaenaceae cyanobacterium LEGE 13415]
GTIPLVAVFLIQELHLLLKPTLIAITDRSITLRGVLTIADQITAVQGTTKAFEFYQTVTHDISQIETVALGKDWQGQSIALIKTVTRDYFRFGKHLSSAEQRWLVHELQTFVQSAKQHLEQQVQEHSGQQQNTKLAAFDLLFQQGIIEYKDNQIEQSATLFNAILLLDSFCAEAYNNLGVIYYQQQQFSEAIESFQTALQLAPSYWAARTNLAIVYQTQGLHEKEIATYGTPCPAGKNTGADKYTLILLPPWRESLESAIASHQVPPADEPMIAAKRYCVHADLLQFQGNFTGAIDIYRHVLNLVKHDRKQTADLYADLAWVFAITCNHKEAQLCLQKHSKIAPNAENPTVRYTKALINYQQGKF